MRQKIAVLGSTSFCGASFIDYALGHSVEILGVSRSHEPSSALLAYGCHPHREFFKFVQADLNKDLSKICDCLDAFAPSYIIDFAGQGMVAPSWEHPHQWFRTNVLSKIMLHEHLRKSRYLKKYIRFSTPEVYGSTNERVKEGFSLDPSTPYAASHASIDLSLKTFFQGYGFPVILTRSSNFFGPFQQLYRIVPRSILYAKMGRTLDLHGGGLAIRNFIPVRDVCEATWRILEDGVPGETYHISGDEYVSIRDLVQTTCKLLKISFDSFVKEAPDRLGKDNAYYLDSEKIRKTLRWMPQRTIEQGLMETIKWVDKYYEELSQLELTYQHRE